MIERASQQVIVSAAVTWAQHAVAYHWRRFVRFGCVGAVGVVINSLALFVLVEVGGLKPLMAAAFATELTIVANFTLNDRWTFKDIRPGISWFGRLARYNSIALGGLALSIAVLGVLTTALHVHYLVANFVAIAAGTVWNYCVNVRCTWVASSRRVAGKAERSGLSGIWTRHARTVVTKER
ncbi:MAG: GtrA family protein [Gammaproteobacteria bacterium]|nr:GtrA family protein [Gammaproteobacteria bacterium]